MLTSWLKGQGGTFTQMHLSTSQGVRGLQMTETVENGHVIAHIPLSACISAKRLQQEHPGLAEVVEFAETPDERQVLIVALRLLVIKHSEQLLQYWRPYLGLLPAQFHLPVNYTVDELKALSGSNTLLRMVKHQWTSLKTLQKQLLSKPHLIAAVEPPSLEEVIWAYSVAQSRGFNIHTDDDPDSEATDFMLIPLIDMMNHDSASEADIRMSVAMGPSGKQEVLVSANGRFFQGTPFAGRYMKATVSMASWLASYGFINGKTMHQGLRLDPAALWRVAEFPEAHQTRLAKVQDSVGCESDRWRTTPFALSTHGFSDGYLLCLRLALLSPNDYDRFSTGGLTMHMDEMLSKENEQRVLSTLLSHLRRMIAAYPTTLADDHKALASLQGDQTNMRNIVTLRL